MICGCPRLQDFDAWSTHTLLPAFVPGRGYAAASVIRRRGLSYWRGGQKNSAAPAERCIAAGTTARARGTRSVERELRIYLDLEVRRVAAGTVAR